MNGRCLALWFSLALVISGQEPLHFGDGSAEYDFTVSKSQLALCFADGVAPKDGPSFSAFCETWISLRLGRTAHLGLSLAPHRSCVVKLADPETALSVARQLRGSPELQSAYPILHLGDPAHLHSLHLVNGDVAVGVKNASALEALARDWELRLVRTCAWPGTGVLRPIARDTRDPLEIAWALQRDPRVHFAHPDWLRPLPVREHIPNDPQFGNQWHLRNVGQGGGLAGADVHASQAWDITRGSASIIIAVIDSGVERTHADLNQTALGFNPICGAGPLAGDPTPACNGSAFAGSHGTQCAGVAAGRLNNNLGVAGVAGDCTIMPINLLGSGLGFGTPSLEAACFDWAAANGAAVITNSWGPDGVPWPLPSLVNAAFLNATTNGRGGLGTLIFWAAGNGNEPISSDGYSSSPLTCSVGASTDSDVRALYSDFGPELDFVAPSSGGFLGITTTTTNSSGQSLYTGAFGGTSSAAPLAAGVAALVLSAAPTLTWTQVRTILAETTDRIQASPAPGTGGYYDPTTGKSAWHGRGRINAHAAVLRATGSGAIDFAVTTSGNGDVQVSVAAAPPLAELFIPVSTQTSGALGAGPIAGLGFDAFSTLLYPPNTPPFHVAATAQGTYQFQAGPGTLLLGLRLDARCIAFGPGGPLVSAIRRITF